MRNRVRALRRDGSWGLELLPTFWDDDDNLHCAIDGQDVIAPPEQGDQVQILLDKLAVMNVHVHGCFDCRYFVRSGMQVDSGGTIGFCIEGKLGQWLDIRRDTSNLESSCDAYVFGTDSERLTEAEGFHASRKGLPPYDPWGR